MSKQVDVVTQRQIRRALGPNTLAMMAAHEAGLLAHAETLKQHEDKIDNHQRVIEVVQSMFARLIGDARSEAYESTEPLRRSFFGRLRWLLRGK